MFIFRFLCLFTFCQHKQLPMVAQFFKGYASLEVTRPREVATDLTFLTGLVTYLNIWLIWLRYVTKKTPIMPCGRPDPERSIGRPGAGHPQGVSL
jgi:hypothetical protein